MAEKKKKKLSEEARKARNAYQREWNKNNRDKVKEYNNRYWEKKALTKEG